MCMCVCVCVCVHKHNPAKTAQHSNISIRVILLKFFYLEHKTISMELFSIVIF